jgi:hypothetical protein
MTLFTAARLLAAGENRGSGNTVEDYFTRADSTTTLGTADTGQTWTAHTGTWGISSNQAYLATRSGDSVATVDCGKSDIDFTCNVTLGADGTQPGIVFRATDDQNYLLAFLNNSTGATDDIELYQRVAGAYTKLGTDYRFPGDIANTTITLRVVTSGTSIEIYADGTLRHSHTTSQFQTATRVGLRLNDAGSGCRWDSFVVV